MAKLSKYEIRKQKEEETATTESSKCFCHFNQPKERNITSVKLMKTVMVCL
jgi:hypothetical protein